MRPTTCARRFSRRRSTRNLDSFARFLEVAALLNGQIVNVANIARESAVRVPRFSGISTSLVDTLVGQWLPAWQPRLKVRERAHPKFYLFDCGVARAAGGRLRAPLHDAERGAALETWMLHEIRAHLAHAGAGGSLAYYRTPAGVEVDFIWTGPRRTVGIEVKATRRWRREDGAALRELLDRRVIQTGVVVYGGEHPQKDGRVTVLPIVEFLRRLPDLLT